MDPGLLYTIDDSLRLRLVNRQRQTSTSVSNMVHQPYEDWETSVMKHHLRGSHEMHSLICVL